MDKLISVMVLPFKSVMVKRRTIYVTHSMGTSMMEIITFWDIITSRAAIFTTLPARAFLRSLIASHLKERWDAGDF
jgi:hypothetical protein